MPRPKLSSPNFRLRLRKSRFYIDWTGEAGKTISISCLTDNLEDARRLLAGLRENAEQRFSLMARRSISGSSISEDRRIPRIPVERGGCVYIITNEANPLIKIGRTHGKKKGAVQRLAVHQIGSPVRLSLYGVVSFRTDTEAKCAEAAIHGVFATKRARGEWFDLDPVEAMAMLRRPGIIVRLGHNVVAPRSPESILGKSDIPATPHPTGPM
jgi:hypothetical protein